MIRVDVVNVQSTPCLIPRPTAIVVGREAELRRLETVLGTVPVAIIFGVPGVGKSTLALEYASRWLGPVAHVALGGETAITELVDAVHHQLAVVRRDRSLSDQAQLEDLWSVVERAQCLAVIDDLHALAPPARDLLVDTAARFLRHGRLVAVSRELLPVSPGQPDRLQLRLEALDRGSARLLWDRMSELYGPGGDFETAWQRSHGNPFVLRQAHAGTLSDAHPLESVVRSLDPDDRRLAIALALSHRPLPGEIVASLLPPPRGQRALHVLLIRLIVDLTPDEHYRMQDLFRDRILRDADRDTVRTIAIDLVRALEGSSIDALIKLQEIARHLRLLGRHAQIGSLLAAHGAELLRQGASSVLLQELDTLPPGALTIELQILRALTLARGMQIRRAYRGLRRLADHHGAPRHVRCILATVGAACGELSGARRVLEELLGDPDLEPRLQRLARLALAWTCADQGDARATQRTLEDLEVVGSPVHGLALALRLYLAVLGMQHERGADLAAKILARVRDQPPDLWSQWIAPVLCAVALMQAGRFEETDAALSWMEGCLHRPEDCLELRWLRTMLACERGERLDPLSHFQSMQRVFDLGGHFAGAVFTRMLIGRLLLMLGRRVEGLAALDELTRLCRARDAGGFDTVILAAAQQDPLSPGWLTRQVVVPPSRRGETVRAAVRAALHQACAGRAGGLPHVEIPPTADYAFDRALMGLAHAIIARRRGHARLAARHLRGAVAQAEAGRADDGLIEALYDALPALATEDAAEASEPPLVIDGELHEIRAGMHRLSLTSRVVLRRLVYAFGTASNHWLTRNVIARTLWDTDYDPVRHEGSLRSCIHRLRCLLAGTRAVLQCDDGGYRLLLPPGTVVIPPLAR